MTFEKFREEFAVYYKDISQSLYEYASKKDCWNNNLKSELKELFSDETEKINGIFNSTDEKLYQVWFNSHGLHEYEDTSECWFCDECLECEINRLEIDRMDEDDKPDMNEITWYYRDRNKKLYDFAQQISKGA
jgi:hypothetical protein